jgi:shikimate dehydrogenase
MDANTKLVGVVGHPVSHSLSPAFWNPAMQVAGQNAVFLAFDVAPDDFDTFIDGMAAAGARGLNVTIPHKRAAFERSVRRSSEAEGTGAVNVLVFEDGAVVGHNTDVAGVLRAVSELHGDLLGTTALVLGAGGAGRAACWALRAGGAEVLVANRTAERAADLANSMGVAAVTWDDLPLEDVDLVVNTTSVGLNDDASPLDADGLSRGAAARLRSVFDVVYRAGETELVRLARSAGVAATDGLAMLVYQAAEAYGLFFATDAPLAAMFEAAWDAAGRTVDPIRTD